MGTVRVAMRLGWNTVRYPCLKKTGRAGRLEALSLEVTHRCICRCRMCNIWKIPPEAPDPPLQSLLTLLDSPALKSLRELDITGGEPFLRPDLMALVKGVCDRKENFPRLKTVAVTTNGILTRQILEGVAEIAGPLGRKGIDLVLACGCDAVGGVHDRIRQFPGAWDHLQSTLSGLQELRKTFPNLIVGLKTTIVPWNVHELSRIAAFAEERGFFTIISPAILTGNRFGNLDRQEDLAFSPDQRKKIRDFYMSSHFRWSTHREALVRYLDTGRMEKPCSAGFNYLFIRHNGEVFSCPVILEPLGNAWESSLEELRLSRRAARFRKGVGTFSACATCTEPGMERLAWPFEGSFALRYLLRKGPQKFATLSSHMGFGKYL